MIVIEPTAMDVMLLDAMKTYPDECCGFFFGREENGIRKVSKVMVINNAKEGDKKRRFEIAARDYLRAEEVAETHALTLLGVYHSHPGAPAIPSEQDRIAAQPSFSYVIISVNENGPDHIRSWQLNDNFYFEEEKLNQQFMTL